MYLMKRITTLLLVIFLMIVGSKGIAQNFNTAIFGNTGLPVAFEQAPDYPWVVSDGCVSSSNIVGLKTSWFSTTVDIVEANGSVAFDYKVDSGGYGEKFYFSIDDQDIINVERMDWTTVSYELPKGKHTLKWTYILSGGYQDGFYAYIKNMIIQGINIEKPFLSISRSVIDYKNKVSDSKTTESLEITNLGNRDLVIEEVSGLSTPFEVVSYPTAAIAKGAKAFLEVQYSPTKEGFWKQDIAIVSNAGTSVVSVKALCSESYTVEASGAGQLSSLVQDANCDSITIMGYLNESDFRFMKNNMPNLKYLNLSAASIMGNRIPNYALQSKKTLCEVVLPYTLKVVGYQAFDQCSALQRIVFPEGLEQIEQGGFSKCNISGELVLPDSLVVLGPAAFDESPLTKIVFPNRLKEIGDVAFRSCTNLQDVTLPKKLERIGSSAFSDCFRLHKVTLKGIVPPTLSGDSFNYTKVFFVPRGAGAAYSSAAYWNSLVIIDGDTPVKVEVTLAAAGTLGEEILKQLDYVNKVNELVITGPLNGDDYYQIQNRMPNLISIDMTNVAMEALPDHFFSQRSALLEIKLPKTLKSIGTSAFQYCYGLTSMVLPEGLTTINPTAFYYCKDLKTINLPASLTALGRECFYECTSLQSITIPKKVTVVEDYTFHGCTSLSEVKLPAGLSEIKGNAFANCHALTSIELPDALSFLRSQAFRECTGLTEITLPASLQYCDYPFYNCSNIKRINCYASVPPTLEGNRDILYNVDKSTCELLVPFWSVNNYKLTPGWDAFPVINPSEYETDVINIRGNLTLAEGIRPTLQPCVSVFDNGHFAVKGTDAFSMKRYTQSYVLAMYANSSNYDRSQYTSLISESAAMRADSVIYTMSAWGGVWMYLSFPFDVKMSDIEVSDGGLYAIRKYDGATRAQGGTNNWKDMTDDSMLHAGEGYIIQFNKNVNRFALKAINNDNKNRLFSGNALSQELGEYISEFAHNRSWNFVGNPYPCYFDIRYMNYTAPVTVWNGRGYTAISPEDDNYILKPMQAFFVQKPVDMSAITFLPEGRQMDTSIRARMAVRTAAVESNRTIYNLVLAGSEYTDNTRIVVNPAMSMGYDMARDAAKFMSDDKEVPQLFSLDASSMRYAINERPVGTGIIPLGVYIGKAGSYTFSLGENMEQYGEVLLIDKQTKREVRLDQESYTFVADAGTYDSRFEMRLDVTPTGVEAGEMISATTVKGGNQQIEITTEKGNLITVYGTTGQEQTKQIASESSVTIPSVPGFYVVVVNGESFKTVVTK